LDLPWFLQHFRFLQALLHLEEGSLAMLNESWYWSISRP
jgi:hypothetical protein